MRALVVAVLAAGISCSRDPGASSPPAGGTRPQAAATAASDLCGPHGVLATVCPKCNPALEPVFKARGDWCAEHGFPESFCPLCHPERGGRPPGDVSEERAPADGLRVKLKDAGVAERAGLETVAAMAGERSSEIEALALIVPDAGRRAEINARTPGVVEEVHVELGDRVERGQALAVLRSAALGAELSQSRGAASRVAAAEAALTREKELLAGGVASRKEVQAAEQELAAAKADAAAARATLDMVGHAGEGGRYRLVAPIEGVVTARGAVIGRMVHEDEILFEVTDTSKVWAEIEIPEQHLALVQVGQPVEIGVQALGGRTFTGPLASIAPSVDPRTRTVKGRVPLGNPDGALRANMLGRARLAVSDARQGVLVPREAVHHVDDVALLFVRLSPELFETRRVEVKGSDGSLLEVAHGVAAGEEVVTSGSFLLKTETMPGAIGAGCCEVQE